MQEWKELTNWKELPVGEWLVKIKDERRPYGIAKCFLNNQGHKIITIGAMFYFDAGEIEAYSDFFRYEAKKEEEE